MEGTVRNNTVEVEWEVEEVEQETESSEMVLADGEPQESEQSPTKPIVYVRDIDGPEEAYPNQTVNYRVISYSSTPEEEDKKNVKWMVKRGDVLQELDQKGEAIEFHIPENWEGETVSVMAYLRTPDEDVCQITKIKLEAVIVFVNGYWNSGDTVAGIIFHANRKFIGANNALRLALAAQKGIAENIGSEAKEGYWHPEHLRNSAEYFRKKYSEWTLKEIDNFSYIFIDGAEIWRSTGQKRWQAGWEQADILIDTELKAKGVISPDGKQQKKIFFISHSMGAAYAEGVICGWDFRKLRIEQILHFAAADNRDFKVTLPKFTYQINLRYDPVLLYKNADDMAVQKASNVWEALKGIFTKRKNEIPNTFQIKGMLPANYIEHDNGWDIRNHYYSKSFQIWKMVEFLKYII